MGSFRSLGIWTLAMSMWPRSASGFIMPLSVVEPRDAAGAEKKLRFSPGRKVRQEELSVLACNGKSSGIGPYKFPQSHVDRPGLNGHTPQQNVAHLNHDRSEEHTSELQSRQ